MCSETGGFTVVMLPWLAHGHITPFIELAKRLSDKNFHCYICSTEVNLTSINERITGKSHKNSIETLEIHLPTSPELPNPQYHTAKGLPSHLHKKLAKALKASKPEFSNLLKGLKPNLLIHDALIPWAGSVAKKMNIASVRFNTSGAAMLSYLVHMMVHPKKEYPFPAVNLTEFQLSTLFSNLREFRDEEEEKDPDDDAVDPSWKSDEMLLMNITRAMEGKYMDYASELFKSKIVPIGAMILDPSTESEDGYDGGELMDWLGSKDELSSVLVSFGTNCFLKIEEIHEIAYGLELSNANFIWIVRFPRGDETKACNVLPEGFLERVGERGRVVEEWAPQARILGHPSVGGFVSHCGWNSLIESLEFLVPIIAMPMHLDQPMNAKLVTELGYGVEVQRDGEGRLQRKEIAKVIKDVVFGEKGRALRSRAADLREEVRTRSRQEFEGAVEMLEQLCGKKI